MNQSNQQIDEKFELKSPWNYILFAAIAIVILMILWILWAKFGREDSKRQNKETDWGEFERDIGRRLDELADDHSLGDDW